MCIYALARHYILLWSFTELSMLSMSLRVQPMSSKLLPALWQVVCVYISNFRWNSQYQNKSYNEYAPRRYSMNDEIQKHCPLQYKKRAIFGQITRKSDLKIDLLYYKAYRRFCMKPCTLQKKNHQLQTMATGSTRLATTSLWHIPLRSQIK